MIVKSMNESAIYAIGHAFGYYDYGEETGMVYAFFGQEPTAQYICAYVRGMLRGGFLPHDRASAARVTSPTSGPRKSSASRPFGRSRRECCTIRA